MTRLQRPDGQAGPIRQGRRTVVPAGDQEPGGWTLHGLAGGLAAVSGRIRRHLRSGHRASLAARIHDPDLGLAAPAALTRRSSRSTAAG